jgi:truncated hemoglobin YjbI
MIKFNKSAALGLLLASSLAFAETPYTEDSTYRDLGGKEGVQRITATFLALVTSDPRIKETFNDFDLKQLNQRLQDQFCEMAGGPCKYTGKYRDRTMDGAGVARDMKSVHIDLKISQAQFDALAEDLQIAMEQHDVPAGVSDKLIDKLAPMQRDIVTR